MRRGLFLLMLLLWATAAEATQERVALVIGNSAYQSGNPLPNAANDGTAMATALRRVGFDVYDGIDLDRTRTFALLRRFAEALDRAQVAVFFYAGHGLQVGGENYLVPVDAKLEHEIDLDSETLALKTILGQLERTDRTSIVMLDACRDNPFAQRVRRTMSRSVAVGAGLAPVQSGVGTLIAYATQPENVAQDGAGSHSPFTAALLRHLETPGLEVSQLMKRVRQDVISETAYAQVPWDHSSLVGDFYFVPPVATETAVARAEPAPAGARSEEQSYWDGTQQIGDRSRKLRALETYLQLYPEGAFASLARLQIDDLRQPAAPARGEGTRVATLTHNEEPPAVAPSPAEQAERALGLDRGERRNVQLHLTRLGLDTRGTDGSFGPRTRAQIAAFQKRAGLPVTGFLDGPTLAELAAAAAAVDAPSVAQNAGRAPAPTNRAEPATAAAPAPGAIVQCRGPADPDWMDFRLVTLAQCRALGGEWTLP